jgi:hypothetical protein
MPRLTARVTAERRRRVNRGRQPAPGPQLEVWLAVSPVEDAQYSKEQQSRQRSKNEAAVHRQAGAVHVGQSGLIGLLYYERGPTPPDLGAFETLIGARRVSR